MATTWTPEFKESDNYWKYSFHIILLLLLLLNHNFSDIFSTVQNNFGSLDYLFHC